MSETMSVGIVVDAEHEAVRSEPRWSQRSTRRAAPAFAQEVYDEICMPLRKLKTGEEGQLRQARRQVLKEHQKRRTKRSRT